MIVAIMKPVPRRGVHARLEHVMAPDDEAQAGDAGDRVDHRPVAEQRLAGEGGDDVGDHAHRRQDHDVDGRVRVEPEQVLPQQRSAAADDRRGSWPPSSRPGWKKFVPIVWSSSLQDQGRGQHRQGERLEDGGDEHGPDGHRHAEHRHAGGPQLDDRRDVVDRPHHRRDPRRTAGPAARRSAR